jgi:hypothetical protein
MKKNLAFFICICFMTSCSLFKKSEKLGCASDGRNIGAEKLAQGDAKAMKASSKAKYKGGRKSYQEK